MCVERSMSREIMHEHLTRSSDKGAPSSIHVVRFHVQCRAGNECVHSHTGQVLSQCAILAAAFLQDSCTYVLMFTAKQRQREH